MVLIPQFLLQLKLFLHLPLNQHIHLFTHLLKRPLHFLFHSFNLFINVCLDLFNVFLDSFNFFFNSLPHVFLEDLYLVIKLFFNGVNVLVNFGNFVVDSPHFSFPFFLFRERHGHCNVLLVVSNSPKGSECSDLLQKEQLALDIFDYSDHLHLFEGVADDGDEQVHHDDEDQQRCECKEYSMQSVEVLEVELSESQQKGFLQKSSMIVVWILQTLDVQKDESESQTRVAQERQEAQHVLQTCDHHRSYVARGAEAAEVRESAQSCKHYSCEVKILDDVRLHIKRDESQQNQNQKSVEKVDAISEILKIFPSKCLQL